MALEGVQVIGVGVSDHEKALDFYVNKMGLEKRMDESWGEGNRFLAVGIPGDPTMIVLNTGNDRVGEMTSIVIGSSDPEADAKELEDAALSSWTRCRSASGAGRWARSRTRTATFSRSTTASRSGFHSRADLPLRGWPGSRGRSGRKPALEESPDTAGRGGW